MNKTLICGLLLVSIMACTPPTPIEVNVIPQPNEVLKSAGRVKWSGEITINAQSVEEKAIAGFLAEFLATKGVKAKISSTETNPDVKLRTEQKAGTSNEAYQLEINDNEVLLVASSGAGLFYGVQTLFQLIQGNEGVELPYVKITDAHASLIEAFTWMSGAIFFRSSL